MSLGFITAIDQPNTLSGANIPNLDSAGSAIGDESSIGRKYKSPNFKFGWIWAGQFASFGAGLRINEHDMISTQRCQRFSIRRASNFSSKANRSQSGYDSRRHGIAMSIKLRWFGADALRWCRNGRHRYYEATRRSKNGTKHTDQHNQSDGIGTGL